MAKDAERHFQTDYEYKMFFGKWEVTEFMGKGQYCYGEKQEAFIGSTVYYDNSKIQINEVTVLKRPTYQFGIIPNDKHSIYTQIYPAEGSDVLWGREEGDFFEFSDKFYIVDENTIILDTEDGWYKMKRLDYIDGYPQNIQSIWQYYFRKEKPGNHPVNGIMNLHGRHHRGSVTANTWHNGMVTSKIL